MSPFRSSSRIGRATSFDQRAAEPAAVRIEKSGKVTTYRYTLQGEGVQVRVQERVDIDDKSVALQYEIVPVQDVLTETVVLRGLMPAETHAGVTHYVVGDVNSSGGLCPAALNRDAYVIYNGAAEWIGFAPRGALALRDGDKMGTGSAAPSVGPREPRPSEVPVPILSQALRVVPQDLALQFQDDRKWNTPGFSLLATTRRRQTAGRQTDPLCDFLPRRYGRATRSRRETDAARRSGRHETHRREAAFDRCDEAR